MSSTTVMVTVLADVGRRVGSVGTESEFSHEEILMNSSFTTTPSTRGPHTESHRPGSKKPVL